MPTSISEAMLTEMETRPDRVHMVIEMTWGGTTYKYSTHSVASESKGLYRPLIVKMSRIEDEANVWQKSIGLPRFSFSIFDDDRTLQKLFGGPLRGQMTFGTVELWWRSPAVDADEHHLRFRGVVTKPSIDERVFNFSATTETGALDGNLKIPIFPRHDFRFAPEKSTGVPLWVVYGRNNSSGLSDSIGMIQCVAAYKQLVSTHVDLWIANYGQLAAVNRVYLDIGGTGNYVDRTSHFDNFVMQRGTGLYHVVKYNQSTGHPTKASEVRVDCDGLMSDSPTSGSVIRNPAAQIRHALTNFVFGPGNVRPRAEWEPESNHAIGSTTFDEAETFYTSRNIEGAMVLRGDRTGKAMFNQWCQEMMATPFFEDGWKLAAKPRNLHDRNIYYEDRHVAQILQHPRSPLTMESERAKYVTDVDVEYLWDDARQEYTKNLKVSLRRPGAPIVYDEIQIQFGRHSVF